MAGDPVLITYCPLCGSAIAFDRRIDGEAVEFGTTGKLYNSNLVMYDRKSDTYWTQVEGKAIIGGLTGKKLKPLSIDTVIWGNWKKFPPDSEVLSRATGFSRSYGLDPYSNYYLAEELMFPVENMDRSLHPKEVILGIEIDGVNKAYRKEDIVRLAPIIDRVNGIELRIDRDPSGVVKITRLSDGERIVKERDFWFAWYAFHPDTLLYEEP